VAADVSTSLPQLDLAPFAIVTVTLDDPAAVITTLRVHGWQAIPTPGPELLKLQPLFVPLDDEAGL
jgi:hypothetical protein